jgi:hypothetical protein
MPQANLNRTPSEISAGLDEIVIVNLIEDIPGGKTLDVTGVTAEVIKAGHIIIEETATGDHKPLALSGSDYAALPGGHTYKGVLVASILTSKPMASIMVRGTVNEEAAVEQAGLPSVPAGAKTALPLIRFTKE